MRNKILAREWISSFFQGEKKPSIKKIKTEIDNGNLPGGKVANTNIYFVFCDDKYNPVFKIEEAQTFKPTGNKKADDILKQYKKTA